MKSIKKLATNVVKEELSGEKKDYAGAEYTIYVKPNEVNDLARWTHDLAQRKLEVTVEDGIHQITGDGAAIITLMMNQGMPKKEITRRFDDQAREQFRRERMYNDFEDSDKSSNYANRRRNRMYRHKERMRPAFSIKGIGEDVKTLEEGKKFNFNRISRQFSQLIELTSNDASLSIFLDEQPSTVSNSFERFQNLLNDAYDAYEDFLDNIDD